MNLGLLDDEWPATSSLSEPIVEVFECGCLCGLGEGDGACVFCVSLCERPDAGMVF